MGWRFRQIFRSGPFRWSLSKKGVGWSFGIPGLRYGISPTSQRYISIGIPGTGVYYIKYLNAKKVSSTSSPQSTNSPTTAQSPKPASSATAWWKQKNLP